MLITSLIDDYCPQRGFRGEHGLALHLESGGFKLLFDTGQSDAFIANAQRLGVNLAAIDAVVLSHGHYDHGGGLAALYEICKPSAPPFYVGRGYDEPRWVLRDGGLADIGLAGALPPALAAVARSVDAEIELAPGLFILPRADRPDIAAADAKFQKTENGNTVVDEFGDELSLVHVEPDGLVVATGCAHRGIAAIVEAARQRFPGKPLKALIGGFHLAEAPDDALVRTARAVAALDCPLILCGHCTGPRGFAALKDYCRGEVRWLSCGMSLSVGG